MTTSTLQSFDTLHEDMIHDAQLDYYGKRLATCSSDRSIKIFETGEKQRVIAELKGHDGPVWQVAWAHPQFGNILASCSYDHKVIIWRENNNTQWSKIYEYKHEASVNAISWAPQELGLCLAAASSDNNVSVITFREHSNSWDVTLIRKAHETGCNAVSWAPATPAGSLFSSSDKPSQLVKQIVTGGGDNLVRIWRYTDNEDWTQEVQLQGHSDWVRDVAWAPNVGLPYDTIASCSQDRTVIIWTKTSNSATWEKNPVKFNAVVWRVSWSITGNILAVSTADNQVTLWKEVDQKWVKLTQLSDSQQGNKDKNQVTNNNNNNNNHSNNNNTK